MALKRNRPWTPEHDGRLLEMRAAGRPTFAIVAAFNRNAEAVGARQLILRQRVIEPGCRQGTPSNEQEYVGIGYLSPAGQHGRNGCNPRLS